MNPRCERTKTLAELDRTHLWHPFTQAEEWDAEDMLIVERGEGSWLFDTDGNRYLDGISSLWVNIHGHRHPAVDRAIIEQLGRVAHTTLLGQGSPPSIELARRLVGLAPGSLNRVFYSDSGSTSVEVALKMAYQYFQQRGRPGDSARRRFLAFTDAYHGDTVGSVSLGGIDLFHGMYKPLLFDALRAPYPYCYRCPLGKSEGTCGLACVKKLEKILEMHGRETAAVVIEPLVQGAAGIITAPEGYLRAVSDLSKKHGVLLVCDEVATGFGRTGTMFACEQEGVEPDFMCVAKGISAGYLPLAATLTTEEVYEAFRGPYTAHRTFYHGHSYTGNPLACAAALASLDVFEQEKVLEKLPAKMEHLDRLLRKKISPHPHVGDVRRRGLMAGIELVANRETKESFPVARRIGRQVILEARKRGVIIRPLGDVVVLLPPLSISEEEIDLLVEVTAQAIEVVTGVGA
jgi:adenosylmethionine-8-amino-7-oxononanoate aminotransferase